MDWIDLALAKYTCEPGNEISGFIKFWKVFSG